MCTAITYKTKDFYFGRTLDYEFSYGDEVTITPRNYKFKFRHVENIDKHYAMIGMAYNADNYPFYYEAMNEKGVCIAGLNFVGNAYYREPIEGKENICQFEFIPWLLSDCANMEDVTKKLENLNLTNESYSSELPIASLHWIISYNDESITVESVIDGIKIYKNPVGALTNNPTFDIQMFNLNNYMNLSSKAPSNNFCHNLDLKSYSRGMGALGLPGDLSSMSRFVRVSYTKVNSISKEDETSSVSQFFHILNSVDQQRGCCILDNNECEITIYTCCLNSNKGIYYYTTYDNHQINRIDMFKENLDVDTIIRYKLNSEENFNFQN